MEGGGFEELFLWVLLIYELSGLSMSIYLIHFECHVP